MIGRIAAFVALALSSGCHHPGPIVAPHAADAPVVWVDTEDGAQIALQRHVTPGGPPIVLCHGISSNHHFWDLAPDRSLALDLHARGYDVWNLDLRGHGFAERLRSGKRQRGRWTIDDYGRHDLPAAFAHVLDATGAERLAFVGHSMGGMVLALYLTEAPDPPLSSAVVVASPLDFTEPDRLISRLVEEGVEILNVTIGNPYYNPHINRPYRKGGYTPPETHAEGLARFVTVERHIKETFPTLTVVGSGLSYYRDDLMEQAESQLTDGGCDLVGFGRMWLAYPAFYRDYTEGNFTPKKCCLACSKCTELMRAGQVSGCAVFNEYYRNLYQEVKS